MKNILLQLDGDSQPSVFDSVVAVDASVDHLFRHANVTPAIVRDLVHGLMFTRGPKDLHHSAIFVGGSDVSVGEDLLKAVTKCFFGPLRCSVMLDANGANTTAAAAVLAAAKLLKLADVTALVLAGTGPVGQRIARLLARQGATVRVASRKLDRAESACAAIAAKIPGAKLSAVATPDEVTTQAALVGVSVVFAAGAAGIELLSEAGRKQARDLKVAIDLNAVPPVGLAGIDVQDKAVDRDGVKCFGAIGVGGTKMKIHRAALEQLFTKNDQVLDAEEIYSIGEKL